MLELTAITKSYGRHLAVDNVSLTIGNGEFVTLLGPSGSGKSTILSLIAGFTPITGGVIRIDGRDVSRSTAAERGIGVVFQNYALFPHLTVSDNIAYGLRRRDWAAARIATRVEEMLSLIGLPGVGQRRPHQLSGGQQQRVALARALAFSPSVLLMDEPLGALDREIRDQMQQEIRRIHRETRPSVVYVTHNREEAFALSDRVAILESGRLMAYDTARALYSDPPNEFVAAFFGGHQLFDVEVVSTGTPAQIRLHGQVVHVTGNARIAGPGPARLAVAARQIKPGSLPAEGVVLDTRVVDVVYMGDTTRAICRLGGGERLVAEYDSQSFTGAAIGEAMPVTVCVAHAALVRKGE